VTWQQDVEKLLQFLDDRYPHTEILEELSTRLTRYEEALREIASCDCQIACASLPNASKCVTCVARAALADEERGT
jgi:hypothetical protein